MDTEYYLTCKICILLDDIKEFFAERRKRRDRRVLILINLYHETNLNLLVEHTLHIMRFAFLT